MDSWILQVRRLLRPLRSGAGGETTLDRLVREDAEDPSGEEGLAASTRLVVDLGRALLSLGLPAQRLEEALERLAEALGCQVDAFSTPTALMLTVSDGAARRTRVVRVEPGETDLERLSALHDLVGRVERHELTPADASRRVRGILARKDRYPAALTVACYGGASAGASVLLGGGLTDLGPALGLGVLVGLLVRVARAAPNFGRIVPVLAATAITVLARAIGATGVPVHESILVLASIIVLLPGFTLTIATMELATANVVSGTSRLVGGFATLIQLGFGVALGHRLAELLPHVATADAPAAPEGLLWVGYGVATLSFTVLLKAAPRDLLSILVAAAVAVFGANLGREWLGPELGALVGATLLGVVSHLHARMRDRPVLLLMTPGILMLVPGSVGFLSVSSMLDAEVVVALQTAFRMILIATSLAAGVLVATVAVPPRRAL
ncbi:MAG: threonine/serine exporter family protein [Sandaracinaceae bacterium]|nr:threonine/serine exporter family protein [Sandaracinaceae bacterium]